MDLDEAQRRVLKRLGPYVGDVDSVHARGVMQLLQPLRQQIFNELVRAEAAGDHGQQSREE